jgi:cell division protein FtsB
VNVDLGIWSKLTKAVVLLLGLAGVLGVALWYAPLIERNERMRKQIYQYDLQILKEADDGRLLKSAIDALSRDPKAVERQVRETLGYAKPGETVFHFERAPPTEPARR